ncbi:9309_t:CDS:1 [Ambispora gerdemannii]|uniref:9309_t:CDS:1 n=1 Tax=Ambispora gerdemannii TaxID=144530 RepID=A0A9N9D3G0_9GLOM|nr:9309_t:CDS:1 [Ambispora gerdemannii]
MTEKPILNNGVSVANLDIQKQLTKISGILTSPIQLRGENTQEPYYYSFIRLKGQKVDLPVIFKSKSPDNQLIEPKFKKGDAVELSGHYSNSPHSIRKSFTGLDYKKFISSIHEFKVINKECFGCGDKFICSSQENFDYCSSCELNGSRHIPGRFTKNKCSECGDGSGTIKFPGQPPRNCRTCQLAKISILEQAKSQLPLLEKEAEKITQTRQRLENHE